MVEVWQGIRRVGQQMWRNVIEETPGQGEKPQIFPVFFPPRWFDNPADISLSALLEASLRRREQEGSEGGTSQPDK